MGLDRKDRPFCGKEFIRPSVVVESASVSFSTIDSLAKPDTLIEAMITAQIRDGIFWIIIDGDVSYDEFVEAVTPLEYGPIPYVGFVSDGRKLSAGRFRGIDMMKIARYHKEHHPEMPNAVLMNENGMVMIANIYIQLTNAPYTRIFTTEADAILWIREETADSK